MAFTYKKGYYTPDSKWSEDIVTDGVGATLRVYRESVQVMSDVWEMATVADYWDPAEGKVRKAYWVIEGSVDATPDVIAEVKKYCYSRAFDKVYFQARDEAETVKKGSTVKVTSGRSGKGLVGTVVVEILRPYKMGWRSVMLPKLGIATSDVKVKVAASNGKVYENYRDITWVWRRNCELVNVPEINIQEVKERAEAIGEADFKAIYKKA